MILLNSFSGVPRQDELAGFSEVRILQMVNPGQSPQFGGVFLGNYTFDF